ncbi:ABC transporter ATP-binding protein [Candidatus Saccharibacteria bacterium]|jgi:ABC transporter, ATP-binding protein|nr:ABC transporter ATP-binding protein [Candidatus Saccharibacteria bacterium]TWP15183.1 ABC transporter ATP-binding protein [TM7 phylum sp. oral taxon 353]
MQENTPNNRNDSLDEQHQAIIQANHLVKRYKTGSQTILAVNDVSLAINRGEFVAITGASGSGKSTLLQLLGGLDKPTSGDIIIDNVKINKISDSELSRFRNQTIGFVFQSFYLQPFLTLQRNIEIAAMPSRMKRNQRKTRAEKLAQQVGLGDRLRHFPRELSGGQIQRAAIARALLNNPDIILADEPTGNLDSQNSRNIVALFRQICDTQNTTVVIATHDQEIAASVDRVIAVADGRII